MEYFEPPRDATIEALYDWAMEAAEKLNYIQSQNAEREGEDNGVDL